MDCGCSLVIRIPRCFHSTRFFFFHFPAASSMLLFETLNTNVNRHQINQDEEKFKSQVIKDQEKQQRKKDLSERVEVGGI